MFGKLNRLFKEESGITALETAIILIAFVVVASVFAFTILSAGTSSTEKSKDAIYSGLEQVEGSMEVVGDVIAEKDGSLGEVKYITFTLASAGGGEGVNITDTVGTGTVVVIDYRDETHYASNIDWSISWLACSEDATGVTNCDDLLEEDEQVAVCVTVSAYDLGTSTDFVIEIKPPTGGVIPIARRTPASLDTIMNLH